MKFTIAPEVARRLQYVTSKEIQFHNSLSNVLFMRKAPKCPLKDEGEHSCLAATNGRVIAFVKGFTIETQEGEGKETEQISGRLIERMAKMKTQPTVDILVNGKQTIKTPEEEIILVEEEFGTYPDISRVIPQMEGKNTISINLNPQLLVSLAIALGSAEGIKLTVDLDAIDKEKKEVNSAILAEGLRDWGVFMPCVSH